MIQETAIQEYNWVVLELMSCIWVSNTCVHPGVARSITKAGCCCVGTIPCGKTGKMANTTGKE